MRLSMHAHTEELTVNVFKAPCFCSKCAASPQQHGCHISSISLLPFSAESSSPEWDPGCPPKPRASLTFPQTHEMRISRSYGGSSIFSETSLRWVGCKDHHESEQVPRLPRPLCPGFFTNWESGNIGLKIPSLISVPRTTSLLISLLQKTPE